ncbi:DUF1634 domain-containing protein [Acidimicrobiaceae bacterium USS-CC1]|uniref:DUF1634 domain-containing protein n=1 Tax=Acidiferrimicrobium australe TaxID=2664430 RepID=A0ABW9QWT0_9ACTN|nr:DUF1634 domain-containing protein [Acidiferrimicrobium australe]
MTHVSGPEGAARSGAATGEPPIELPPAARRGRRQLSAGEVARMEEKIRRVETAISLVLRVGVVLSVLVVAVGLGLMFAHHRPYLPVSGRFSYRNLTSPATPFPHSFRSLGRSIARGDGRGVIVLGVLILIATPVLRVAVGVLSFLYQGDRPMAAVTLYVLALLVGSFFLAGL